MAMEFEYKNPETGKSGKDLRRYRKKNNLSMFDVSLKTKIHNVYLGDLERLDKPIKKNLYIRLKKGLPDF